MNLVLLLWVSLLASSFVMSAVMVEYAPPVASTGLRFLLAVLIMLPFLIRQLKPYCSPMLIARYALISLFLVLFFVGLFESLKTTTALNSSVIYTFVPLFSVVLAWITLRACTAITQLTGFLLGAMGALWVLLSGPQSAAGQLRWNDGDLLCIAACISLAMHVVLAKKWAYLAPPAVGAFWLQATGSLMLLPFLLLGDQLEQVLWREPMFWQTLLYLVLFTTVVTAILQQFLVRTVGPNRLLAFTYLVPSLVVIMEGQITWVLTAQLLPGFILTGLALYLITRPVVSQ